MRVRFDLRKENDKLKIIHRTFFERAAGLGAAQIAADLAAPVIETVEQVLRRQAMQRTLIASAVNISKINATTAARVARTLTEGLEAGEAIPELKTRLMTEASFSGERAQTIARTHTGSAVSAGRHEAARLLGAELKFWLTSRDTAVRDTHKAAEQTHKDGIPLDEPFWVGGDALLHPGDPKGSPANIVNCRCLELIKTAAGKTFDLDYYDRAKWLGYEAFKTLLNKAA
jgi:uncharacterized protein with gpF-like domain